MKLDLGSFAFGAETITPGGNPSWGTSLGQKQPELKLTYPGHESIIEGMLYKSIPTAKVFMPIGKGGRVYNGVEDEGIQLAALFDKVYVNDIRVNANFILVVYRDSSNSWDGRRTLKYGTKIEYRESNTKIFSNSDFVQAVEEALQLEENASWVASDIYVVNQDELHFVVGIVNPNGPEMFSDSETRKKKWMEVIQSYYDDNADYLARLDEGSIARFPQQYNNSLPLQQIYYGAPGTGKSHEVKMKTGELDAAGNEYERPNVFRTTFHPDTDYATFVGCYKPTMKPVEEKYRAVAGKEEDIAYEFVPQAFTDAYVYAYNHPGVNTFLVIEEINRGNCAQIFGDLFQLLDRKADGTSEYTIKADKDLANYLMDKLGAERDGIKDGKLRLPANLSILATMNTSDQSLFPMDSAFKRRWDWEYVAISYTEPKSSAFMIKVGDGYKWVDFIKQVNKRIFDLTQSEDKELGNFFIKDSIDAEQFKSKVMFYLWYEVLRDEVENSKYFFYYTQQGEDGKETTKKFTFKDLYGDNADAILEGFLKYMLKGAE